MYASGYYNWRGLDDHFRLLSIHLAVRAVMYGGAVTKYTHWQHHLTKKDQSNYFKIHCIVKDNPVKQDSNSTLLF